MNHLISFLKNLNSNGWYLLSCPFIALYILLSDHEGSIFYNLIGFCFFVFVFCGLQIELRNYYSKYGESTIFKLFQYVFVFLCGYFSIFHVTNLVSDVSGFEGNYFQTTINFLSAILTFFFWILIFSFFGFVYEFFAALHKLISSKNTSQRREVLLSIPKIFFYLVLFVEFASHDFSALGGPMLSIIREVEFRNRSLECRNYDPSTEKIRFVGDEKLLVVNKDGSPQIKARVCKP